MPYPVTIFRPPNGSKSEQEIKNILDQDAEWLRNYRIAISMETLSTGQFVIYADYGKKTKDNVPDELIYIVPMSESCEGAFTRVVEKLKGMVP